MEEHRVIERVLDSLETAASQVEAARAVRPGFFLQAADFIKGFADGCHHKKEEGVLFPAMEAAGVPRYGGPIGVMLAEHEDGRRLTAAMRDAAERLERGDATARADLVRSARGYAALLRQHIMKEDNILFPMADRVIQGRRSAEVVEAFGRVEHEETGEGVHQKYLDLAASLEREVQG